MYSVFEMAKKASPASSATGIAKFMFEVGALKAVPRSGWRLAGVSNQESVAEHSHRAAAIAYALAMAEGADAGRACALLVFHDVAEARIGDLDKLMASYLDKAPAERRAVADQSALAGDWYSSLVSEFEEGRSLEARIAKDADLLECALSAMEYAEAGHPLAIRWADSCSARLTTSFAKAVFKAASKKGAANWWMEKWQNARLTKSRR